MNSPGARRVTPSDRNRERRRGSLRDRTHPFRAHHLSQRLQRAPWGGGKSRENGRQCPEERTISRSVPGLHNDCDERARTADDCLGCACARDDPVEARVAARRRMRKNQRRVHCWIANRRWE